MGDYYADVAVHAPGGLPLKASLLAFDKMTRVLRQSVVIDSRLLTIRLRSEEDECRFLYILAEGWDIVIIENY